MRNNLDHQRAAAWRDSLSGQLKMFLYDNGRVILMLCSAAFMIWMLP